MQSKVVSLERVNALCEFLLDKIEISLLWFLSRNAIIWQETDKKVCQLQSRVNLKPHERDRRIFDYFGINKISSSKGAAKKYVIS